MSSSVRAYVPLIADHLLRDWPSISAVLAFAPDASGRALRSEAGEEAEYRAQCAAAEACLDEAVRTRRPRVIVACDIPAGAPVRPIGAGLEVFGPLDIDPTTVVSFHIDEPEAVAALPADDESAADWLRGEALLWYDVSEVGDLLKAFGQHPLDARSDRSLDG